MHIFDIKIKPLECFRHSRFGMNLWDIFSLEWQFHNIYCRCASHSRAAHEIGISHTKVASRSFSIFLYISHYPDGVVLNLTPYSSYHVWFHWWSRFVETRAVPVLSALIWVAPVSCVWSWKPVYVLTVHRVMSCVGSAICTFGWCSYDCQKFS